MKKISIIYLTSTIVLLSLWIFPQLYNFATMESSKSAFTLYSNSVGDFLTISHDDKNGVFATDSEGNKYTESEIDAALPFFYIRQLMLDQNLPDSVGGVVFDPKLVQQTNFIFRSSPRDLNTPHVGLYFMLESMPKRVELSMPKDVFRITNNGVEFINMEQNMVDKDKSTLFTDAMKAKGFVFPARDLSGNPNVKKDYDEGYLMVDTEGKIFHIKMTAGRPYVAKVTTPADFATQKVFIVENRDRSVLGFVVAEGVFYVLRRENYTLHQSGIDKFDPYNDNLLIVGNMLDWTFRIQNDEAFATYALNANDYTLLKKDVVKIGSERIPGITFTSGDDKYVKFRLL